MKTYKNVDAYIKAANADTQALLKSVRAAVKKAAPKAEEGIAYGMPAYSWNGKPLFYFAGQKGHLGLYPTPGPITALKAKLAAYSTSKGCIRVPYAKGIPAPLITALIKERMKEIRAEK